MAKSQADALFERLHANGLRKRVARDLSKALSKANGTRASGAATATIGELRRMVADLEARATGGSPADDRSAAAKKAAATRKRDASKRSAAAKKAAATRKRKANQRSAAAKKAAQTRAKNSRSSGSRSRARSKSK